jgi:putative flavoprotein involved in K+ transport
MDGAYVLGLPWLHTWGSGRFVGVGRDAEFISKRIAAHLTVSQRGSSAQRRFPLAGTAA